MDRAELKTGDWVVIRYKIDGIPYIKKLAELSVNWFSPITKLFCSFTGQTKIQSYEKYYNRFAKYLRITCYGFT